MEESRRGRTTKAPSRIDQRDKGEAMALGYVSHARPVPAQTEYIRQQAAKCDDRAQLVEMILGETPADTANVYAAALEDGPLWSLAPGDPYLRELFYEALDNQRLRRQLQILDTDTGAERRTISGASTTLSIVDEVSAWRNANPSIGARLDVAILDEAAA